MGQILAKYCPCLGFLSDNSYDFNNHDENRDNVEMQDHGQVITVEELEEQDYETLKAK